jgi:hypothetical protein
MKSPIIALLALLSFSLSCSRPEGAKTSVAQAVEKSMAAQNEPAARTYMDSATKEAEPAVPLERKIVRNADITIEVASTPQAQHSVTSIAEALGGFVVTSESKQRENIDPSQRSLDFKLVVRIPFDKFGVALDEIRKLAGNVPEEKTTGEDVTEEFIDLEARIKTQKALELQFIEIMKQAKKVEDALEVQSQLAGVRTEIEKLEGRKRFLENRSSLATITVNIQAPKPAIATTPTGFRHSLSEAASEGVELAAGLVLLFVRLGIVLTPVVVLVGVPLVFIVRYARRRMRRMRLAQELATPAAD